MFSTQKNNVARRQEAIDKSASVSGMVKNVANRSSNDLVSTDGQVQLKVLIENTSATQAQQVYLFDSDGWCKELQPVTNQLPTTQVTGTLGPKTYDLLRAFKSLIDIRGLHISNTTGNFLANGSITVVLARFDGTVERNIIPLSSLTDASDNNITFRKIPRFEATINELKGIYVDVPAQTGVAITFGVSSLGLSAQMERVK